MIKVLVVDDHQLVRVGTSRLLDDVDSLDVVDNAENGEEAIEKVRSLDPDLVLMDIQMPGIGGLEATRRCLRINPDLKVIAVTVHEDEPYPSKLFKVGATGYLTKKANVDEMVRAIKQVLTGQRYISTDVAQQLALPPFSQDQASPFAILSSRKMQITLMVIMGHKVTDISERLSLSPKTINSYRYRIFEKLDVANDVGLTKLAIKHGIIDSEAVA
ncbi:MAG TPA: two-component system response regulator UvrY [Gammaproteobacteria bacterium]|nr:two-component system response regulator UvrY [Gammaproteobacteria bacterium]